ncbi:hypothetical protein T03_14183 [Trichinella britovi]|uniref:Uncharacterized protein n=1 Tax=Trichinella britovi TaxID=45882 RepID=A0A0V1D405_TRIBR|nr:hypothetical protein T03_14183 [Trichinella britovi]
MSCLKCIASSEASGNSIYSAAVLDNATVFCFLASQLIATHPVLLLRFLNELARHTNRRRYVRTCSDKCMQRICLTEISKQRNASQETFSAKFIQLVNFKKGSLIKMANKSFNISDLANQNGETVQLHTYAIGTSTTGLAFAIGYYYRIINHDIRFQTTSLRICMTRTPHISLYVVGDTLMAISVLCMSAERLLSVHLAMHLRHLNSKIHLLLTVTTFLWPTIHLLAVWFSIADPEHWNSKVPAVCFLRTTVPKRIKAEIASIRSVQAKFAVMRTPEIYNIKRQSLLSQIICQPVISRILRINDIKKMLNAQFMAVVLKVWVAIHQ